MEERLRLGFGAIGNGDDLYSHQTSATGKTEEEDNAHLAMLRDVQLT